MGTEYRLRIPTGHQDRFVDAPDLVTASQWLHEIHLTEPDARIESRAVELEGERFAVPEAVCGWTTTGPLPAPESWPSTPPFETEAIQIQT